MEIRKTSIYLFLDSFRFYPTDHYKRLAIVFFFTSAFWGILSITAQLASGETLGEFFRNSVFVSEIVHIHIFLIFFILSAFKYKKRWKIGDIVSTTITSEIFVITEEEPGSPARGIDLDGHGRRCTIYYCANDYKRIRTMSIEEMLTSNIKELRIYAAAQQA